jgi:transposase
MKDLLNAKMIKAVATAIADGMSYEYAATIAGVDRKTFYIWRKKGRAAKSGVFHDLHAALEKADAIFVQRNLAIISAHGRTQWQACAWLLERRHPEMFGRADRMQAQQMKELANELKAIRAELASRQAVEMNRASEKTPRLLPSNSGQLKLS